MNIKPEDVIYIASKPLVGMQRANVYWQPNRYCNYECSYCWPTSHTKVKDFCDEQKAYKTIDSLVKQFRERDVKEINWGWSGGESTFHPHYIDFQKRILSHASDDLKMYYNCTTNLSQSMKWWKKFVDETHEYECRTVCASFHQEYVNTEKKIIQFKDKLDFLRDNNFKTKVNQVMDIDLFDDQLENVQIFKDDNYHVSPKINTIMQRMYARHGRKGYTDEQYEYMAHYETDDDTRGHQAYVKTRDGKEYIFNDIERLKPLSLHTDVENFICTAGYLSVTIKGYIGTDKFYITRGVSKCADHIIGELGEDFTLLDEPSLCSGSNGKWCNCVADLKMPKWRAKDSNIIAKE